MQGHSPAPVLTRRRANGPVSVVHDDRRLARQCSEELHPVARLVGGPCLDAPQVTLRLAVLVAPGRKYHEQLGLVTGPRVGVLVLRRVKHQSLGPMVLGIVSRDCRAEQVEPVRDGLTTLNAAGGTQPPRSVQSSVVPSHTSGNFGVGDALRHLNQRERYFLHLVEALPHCHGTLMYMNSVVALAGPRCPPGDEAVARRNGGRSCRA